ncbi:flagellar basal body-associated FliL family protein [Clostridium chauvoei]|uniref:flagellar basal body-associated FliL family protein n=1 Tax=Clostridium chauvoei TaxID=46867 RepID=UPI001C84DB72|nr:flagellar basal body-associated FliL family protein [Clostridium chauvoei]MBX7397761.1 flagellar basal body-associated FliL family protein [Clostridium chauvoei]
MAKDKNEKTGTFKKIIIGILILAVIGLGTFAGVYFGMSKKATAGEIIIEETYCDLGEIFVNLSDDGQKRYVKLTVSIGADKSNEYLLNEIKDKKIVLRDTTIYYFKSCKAKDFTAENEVNLKGELVKRVNQKLKLGLVRDVYINDIIVQ